MWVSRQLYEELTRERQTAVARAAVYAEQNRVHQANMDFLRMRVNQLEKERAILLRHTTTIGIPVPEIAPTPTHVDFGELPDFEDVGDSRAKELGITHTDEGTLAFSR